MRVFMRITSMLLLLMTICGGCTGKSDTKKPVTSIQQLNDSAYTIAVTDSGAPFEAVKNDIPKAKRVHIEGQAAYDAVKMGKVDAYAYDRRQMEIAIADGLKGVKLLPGSIGEGVKISVGLSCAAKIENLKGKINTFLAEIRASGILDDMYSRWVVKNERNMPVIDVPKNSGLKLRVGTTGIVLPYSYYEGATLTGYDIELARRFASWLGAEVEFRVYDYGGVIAAAATGEIDCIMADLNITPERAERIDYSDVLFTEEVALLVKDDSPAVKSEGYSSITDLDGKRIGVLTGSIGGEIVKGVLPSAEVSYHDNYANMTSALSSGKIDALLEDDFVVLELEHNNPDFKHIDGYLRTFDKAFIFTKSPEGDKIRNQFNEFVQKLKADGTLKKISDVWIGFDENKKILPDYESYPATNGTIRFAVDNTTPTFSYVKDGRIVGYDVDLLARFCKAYGYRPEPSPMNFSGELPAVNSGKCLVGISAIAITPERAETVNFSEPVYSGGAMLLVRKSPRDVKHDAKHEAYTKFAEFDGKRVGVFTGNIHGEIVRRVLPNAQISYFDGLANAVAALTSGKIDALANDDSTIMDIERENPSLRHIDEYMQTFDNGFILAKTQKADKLRTELDEFIRSLKADGTLQKIRDVWSGNDDNAKTLPDYTSYPDTNGTLRIAGDFETPPFTYIKDGKMTGYDVDIITRFCKARGYRPEISNINFSGLLPAVMSGKCDVGIGSITITPERAESVNFTESVYTGGAMLLVRKSPQDMNHDVKAETPSELEPFTRAAELDGKHIGEPKRVDGDAAFMLAKTQKADKLRTELDEFIRTIKADGTLQKIRDVWLNSDDSVKTIPDYENYPAANGTLRVVSDFETPPFAYIKDGKFAGYDVDVIVRFCKAYGYRPEILIMNFSALLPAVMSGKSDVGIGAIAITPEREENVNFTEPVYTGGTMLLVRKTPEEMKAADSPAKYRRIADLNGKRIGTDPAMEEWTASIRRQCPDSPISYYNALPDFVAALESRKIDAFPCEVPMIDALMSQNKNVDAIDEILDTTSGAGIVFPKNEKGRKLQAQWNEYITSMQESGKLDAMMKKWTGSDESAKTIADYESFPAPNGVLITATNGTAIPYSYYKDGKLAGFQVDLAVSFCEAYGYGLKFNIIEFGAITAAVKSGKCDFGVASMAITEERSEQVLFSKPYYKFAVKMVVRADELEHSQSPVAAEAPKPEKSLYKFAELAGKRIGIPTGVTEWIDVVNDAIPDAKQVYYNTYADMILALRNYKIDAFVCDMPVLRDIVNTNSDIAGLDKLLEDSIDVSVAIPKTSRGKALKAEWDEFITKLKREGRLDALLSKWLGSDDSAKTVPNYKAFPAPRGVLTMAAEGEDEPFNYYRGAQINGLELDMAAQFCEAYGYGLKVDVMAFDALLQSVASGKCDFAMDLLSITDERTEIMLFSEPYYACASVIAVRAEDKKTLHKPIAASSRGENTRMKDLAGKRIGIPTGVTEWIDVVKDAIPDAKQAYYNTYADMTAALRSRKIDAFVCDTPVLQLIMSRQSDIADFGELLEQSIDVGVAMPLNDKGKVLKAEWDEFITKLKREGRLDPLIRKWTGADESAKTIPNYKAFPAPRGVLTMATGGENEPFTYYRGTELIGFEVDLAAQFCEAYGYGLRIKTMAFDALIPSVMSGKSDFAIALLPITEEHSESALFSIPYYACATSIAVLKTPYNLPAPDVTPKAVLSEISDLSGKRIAVATGTTNPQIAAKYVPDAELVYFNDDVDTLTALTAGKVDAACVGLPLFRQMAAENNRITTLGKQLTFVECAPIFPKNDAGRKLCAQFSEFAKVCWNNGTIQEMDAFWFEQEEDRRTLKDYSHLPSANGTLKIAVNEAFPPFSYIKNNRLVGYDVDFVVRFCEAYGYGLQVMPMNFAAVIPAVISGKCDMGIGAVTITEERAESVLFSYPNARTGNVFVVRKSDTQTPTPAPNTSNIQDLAGKRIAVQVGMNHAQILAELIPSAKLLYFDSQTDLVTALNAEKVEAFCTDIPVAKFMTSGYGSITQLGEALSVIECAPIFPKTEKGRALCEKFTEFTKAAWDNGTIRELEDIWYGNDDNKRVVKDYSSLPAPNGRLKMAVDTSVVPFAYVKDNKIVGYDVDFAVRFCEAYGYGLEIMPMNFSAVMQAIVSGKCDFAANSITITEERAENVLFSYPNVKSGVGVFVKKSEPETQSQPGQDSESGYTRLDDLRGKKVGIILGANHDEFVAKRIPDAKIDYFSDLSTITLALKAGKIDAFANTRPTAIYMTHEHKDISYISEPLESTYTYSSFTNSEKGRKICKEYEEFLQTLWENGTIKRLNDKWVYTEDESSRTIEDYSELPAVNGVLKMAIDIGRMPFAYVKDNKITGYDIELASMFCKAKGYGLEVIALDFAGILGSIKTGKCDLTGSITWTEERAETMLYSSVPNAQTDIVLLTMKKKIVTPESPSGEYNSLQDLAGKKVGVQTGTTNERLVAENIPTAARVYFNTLPDALLALKTGKIDAICCSIYAARYMMIENDDITYLENMLASLELVPTFSPNEKGRRLRDEYSEFLKGLWADGTIQEIDSIWLGKDDSKRVLKDYSKLPAPNGVLKMAAEPTDIPFVYMKDNQFVGYDVDIAVRFCEKYGYGLEVVPMSFIAVVSSINSGKTDFSASMHRTPEREESALFAAVPTAHSGNVIVVRKGRPTPSEGEYSSLQDLAGKRIGAQTGTPNGDVALKFIPTAQIEYFDSVADIVTALKLRKIDAGALALNAAKFMLLDNEDLVFMGKPLAEYDAAPIFAKTDKGKRLCEQYSEFIKTLHDNGTLKALDDVWFGRDDSKRISKDYTKLPATNGTLRMAVDLSLAPFAYVKDNKIVGYEIDCAVMFCEANGYGLEVVPMNFGAIIAAVQSGKCDFASCTIAITPERAEQVLFGYPNAKTGNALVVRKSAPQAKAADISPVKENIAPVVNPAPTVKEAAPSKISIFMDDLKASFNRTFIREDRWRLFVEGIINTMIITVLSILCGTILGFVVYLLCRGGNVIANFITRFSVWLIQGTPMVVLLMILYYIIFGKVDINGMWVAVIAFSMTFGAAVYGMLCSGTGALDVGQTEAAYALGFSDSQTFFRVILPQAALHFMPAYKAEVMTLIKATAIVGYIAVQDLTKMGDIVRSRTYEAFFPLIAVAVIYFVLAGMLNIIVGMIHNRIRPEKRTRDDILRGLNNS